MFAYGHLVLNYDICLTVLQFAAFDLLTGKITLVSLVCSNKKHLLRDSV